MRPPCTQAVVLGSIAALLALAATPVVTAAEGQRLAQAQDRQPDATPGKATDAERVPSLKWLNYSSERFRTLMRMLAARAARSEAKRAAEAKAADDARRADEAKRVAEAKAADDARRADEARRTAEAKAAEEAKRVAEARAADDARRADEARRVADARKAPEIAQDDKKPATDMQPADAGKAAPAPERRRRAPAACRKAGLKVAGAGWYVVPPGDSLWSIARVHYGYGRRYRRIHVANRRTIADPRRIYPCQRIYIPRARFGEAPLQALRVALEPFIRRRTIDTALPGLVD